MSHASFDTSVQISKFSAVTAAGVNFCTVYFFFVFTTHTCTNTCHSSCCESSTSWHITCTCTISRISLPPPPSISTTCPYQHNSCFHDSTGTSTSIRICSTSASICTRATAFTPASAQLPSVRQLRLSALFSASARVHMCFGAHWPGHQH
jgi:hypothetical protein